MALGRCKNRTPAGTRSGVGMAEGGCVGDHINMKTATALGIMCTLFGMALGGWMSGKVFDLTGSYRAAFLNGIAWNALNLTIAFFLLYRTRILARRSAHAPV